MPARQIAEAKISHARAHETFDAISDRFKHATDLAIDALSQDHAQSRGRHGMQSGNFRISIAEKNSAQ
jgi:hypothetical protein